MSLWPARKPRRKSLAGVELRGHAISGCRQPGFVCGRRRRGQQAFPPDQGRRRRADPRKSPGAAPHENSSALSTIQSGSVFWANSRLPVEVIPMARSFVARQFVKARGQPMLREDFLTDNGNRRTGYLQPEYYQSRGDGASLQSDSGRRNSGHFCAAAGRQDNIVRREGQTFRNCREPNSSKLNRWKMASDTGLSNLEVLIP